MKTLRSQRHMTRTSRLMGPRFADGARPLATKGRARTRAARGLIVLALVLGGLGGAALGSLGHGSPGHLGHSPASAHARAVTLSSGSNHPWMYKPWTD